ncbi:hypothetical protein R69658_08137 [Paraburkholderia aspalathi]|uniref:DUF3717 domain-containing protein n=1 Tax=Paraburkholderia aspalathi TaxID=1324617 RepID=A0ABM8T8W3_9BURK|nr:DUF3717 domain-containing protein [Paraburkholderia aspalathi]MBK3824339.1 DUF3717 domain-containing protein [Paraburkholderia aspalathi]MBK3836196.1 DUF3717 domain-containing protein [Paraburkholderia aspalathi]MBK3844634.1 DUF3717 domain-containing protein [Paraburkholderia aspalathi]MBK3865962.1 DUF3717 domain-containing protein [Paraburkholderia aspalathi]CAE6870602.1 hypothetical protein R69658_08137 [Paraburkholderia aspalathi]
MQSFTLAQLERAIQYWRRHHDHARLYHNSSDGARQEQLLTALYGRLIEQRRGAIDLDQISSAEFAALGCLFGVPPAHQEAQDVARDSTGG